MRMGTAPDCEKCGSSKTYEVKAKRDKFVRRFKCKHGHYFGVRRKNRPTDQDPNDYNPDPRKDE